MIATGSYHSCDYGLLTMLITTWHSEKSAVYMIQQVAAKSSQSYRYIGSSQFIQPVHMLQKLWPMCIVVLKKYTEYNAYTELCCSAISNLLSTTPSTASTC